MLRYNKLAMMLASAFAAGFLCLTAFAQSSESPAAENPGARRVQLHHQTNRLPKTQRNFYGCVWGVDSFSVRSVESGQIIRFSFRVLDAAKAKPLNDEKAQPILMDPHAGIQLIVPALEKIGKLRQTATPEAGKTYWMGFSNKGRKAKPGDRVSVKIGSFQVDNLIIQ
jgi:hypothetical protein